jgi:hypothetical protein
MGHWVTISESDGGKVLATRGAIGSAGGGKERGKALAAKSKAAIGKAAAKSTRAIEHAKAAGPSLREQADKARAAKGDREARTAAILAKAKKFHRKTMSTAYQSREAANRAQPRLERLANRTAGVAQANKEERIKQQKARWGSY